MRLWFKGSGRADTFPTAMERLAGHAGADWVRPADGDPRTGRRSPGLGWCFRCGTGWRIVEPHVTPYDSGTSCFPLCEGCWSDLPPRERLPYYALLVRVWEAGLKELEPMGPMPPLDPGIHERIGAAVMAGL